MPRKALIQELGCVSNSWPHLVRATKVGSTRVYAVSLLADVRFSKDKVPSVDWVTRTWSTHRAGFEVPSLYGGNCYT
jgi:hypothetical protein